MNISIQSVLGVLIIYTINTGASPLAISVGGIVEVLTRFSDRPADEVGDMAYHLLLISMGYSHSPDSIVSFIAFLFVRVFRCKCRVQSSDGLMSLKGLLLRGNFVYAGVSIVSAKRTCPHLY